MQSRPQKRVSGTSMLYSVFTVLSISFSVYYQNGKKQEKRFGKKKKYNTIKRKIKEKKIKKHNIGKEN